MQIFACILQFNFIALLNSVQGSPQPPDRNEQRPVRWDVRISPINHLPQLVIVDERTGAVLRATREDILNLPSGIQVPGLNRRSRNRPPTSHQEPRPSQQEPVKLNDGDYIYRGANPVAKVVGQEIHENPVVNDQPQIATHQTGDKIIHNGRVIAEYNDGWQSFHQQG